jgi:hypothetical protein
MAKYLDGIKKLNPDEIKKYRKIVLNYIGENDTPDLKQQKKVEQLNLKQRKVDGLKQNKNISTNSKEKLVLEKLIAEKNQFSEALKRQEEERRKIKEEEKLYKLKKEQEEKDRQEQAERARQEKIRQEEEKLYKLKKEQEEKDRQEQAERARQEKIRQEEEKIKIEKEKQAEREKKEQKERARQEEQKKYELIKQAKREVEEKKRAEEKREQAERIRLQQQKKNEKKIIKENLRQEKIKRQEEIKRIKQEVKISKQIAREKRKLKRQKALRRYFKNLKRKLKEIFSLLRNNLIYIITLTVLTLAILYIIFCLIILRLRINNDLVNQAVETIPVPAVLTSRGIIYYDDFRSLENIGYLNLNQTDKQKYLAKWLILNNFSQKYKLADKATENDIALNFVLDKDFNQIGLSRINKISELIRSGSEIEQAERYADEYNNGTYYDNKTVLEKFGQSVIALNIGQTSNIISRNNGYYLVKIIGNKNGRLGIKYLFVKAQSLDQYINGSLAEIKVFILAN